MINRSLPPWAINTLLTPEAGIWAADVILSQHQTVQTARGVRVYAENLQGNRIPECDVVVEPTHRRRRLPGEMDRDEIWSLVKT